MRMIIMLLVGILSGSLVSIMGMRALSSGNEVPSAVMHLMRYHLAGMSESIDAGNCTAEALDGHIQTLSRITHDIEPVFLPIGGKDDGEFVNYADSLREAIAGMQLKIGDSCDQLAAAESLVKDACKGCHRDFR